MVKPLVLLSLLAYAQAYVKLDFTKTPSSDLAKRDVVDPEAAQLTFDKDQYIVEVAVGTPPQKVLLQIDTGSSDLFVIEESNPYCKNNKNKAPKKKDLESPGDDYPRTPNQVPKSDRTLDCKKYGFYNRNESSTFNSNGTDLFITYGDNGFVRGTWGTDSVSVGNLNLSNLSIGVSPMTNTSTGILGVGLPGEESTFNYSSNVTGPSNYQYSNFPIRLKEEGLIEKIAYSIYLNETGSKYGSILFGAVDHSKYQGPLYTFPLVNSKYKEGSDPFQFEITMNGVGLVGKTDNITLYDQKLPTLLDSGSTISLLPRDVADLVAQQVNGTVDGKGNCIKLPKCPSKKDNQKLIFNFSGAEFSVNVTDFMEKHKGKCYLQFSALDGINFALLGDNFMNNVYTVFNLDDKELSLAQANYNSSLKPDIEEIKDTVPSAVLAPQYYNTFSADPTATAVTGNIFAPEATMSMAAPANASRNSSLNSTFNSSSNYSRVQMKKRTYPNSSSSLQANSAILIMIAAAITAMFL
ncbi:Peptidase family A1 domain profile [Nakaseomyces glabratus]